MWCRYARTALPDAFDERLQWNNGQSRKKLETILKKVPEISEVYVLLQPWGELAEGQSYECAPLASMRETDHADVDRRMSAIKARQDDRAVMNGCAGITVSEDEVRSEADLSIADLRRFKRFGLEYLSWDLAAEDHEVPKADPGPLC